MNKSSRYCLISATYVAFRATFWAAVIPRLCFIGFSFAQPFLINTVIGFIGVPRSEDSHGVVGAWSGATALIPILELPCVFLPATVWILLKTGDFEMPLRAFTYRLSTAVRGGLVAVIFDKS